LASLFTEINSDLHQICRESGGLCKVGGDDTAKNIGEIGCGVPMCFDREASFV
jgi:cell fate regulator YaaT (PSP1 superfamily)